MSPAKRDRDRSEGILAEIVAHKRAEVASRRRVRPLADVRRAAEAATAARGFAEAIKTRDPAVIAEIKRASPSEGVIRDEFDPTGIATSYEQAGAACLSVLTDERYFMGCDRHLGEARDVTRLPTLRKDFIVSRYQLVEARAAGADAVLLIVAALDQSRLRLLHAAAAEYELAVLVEVHDAAELSRALDAGARIVGVNNRNLRTLEVDIEASHALIDRLPPATVSVAESGLRRSQDLVDLRRAGYDAFLIGESLMTRESPGETLAALLRAAAAAA